MQGHSIRMDVRIGQAGGQAATAPSPKLVRAAREFEARMMQELLKPMTGGDPLTGEDEAADRELGSGSGSGGALADFASEALGQALSERGGFGIADKIVRELSHSGHRSKSGAADGTENAGKKVTGALHGDTVIRPVK